MTISSLKYGKQTSFGSTRRYHSHPLNTADDIAGMDWEGSTKGLPLTKMRKKPALQATNDDLPVKMYGLPLAQGLNPSPVFLNITK